MRCSLSEGTSPGPTCAGWCMRSGASLVLKRWSGSAMSPASLGKTRLNRCDGREDDSFEQPFPTAKREELGRTEVTGDCAGNFSCDVQPRLAAHVGPHNLERLKRTAGPATHDSRLT